MSKPGDSDPLPHVESRDASSYLINPADDLMAGDQRSSVQRQVALDDMEVRPTHRANAHLYSHFVCRRLRFIDLVQNEGRFAHRFLLR